MPSPYNDAAAEQCYEPGSSTHPIDLDSIPHHSCLTSSPNDAVGFKGNKAAGVTVQFPEYHRCGLNISFCVCFPHLIGSS